MPHSPWQPIIGHATKLQLNRFSAVVNLARPREGLSEVAIDTHALKNARLLSITAATDDPSEYYVRGTDLIAAYDASGRQPVRVDALWRATPPATADTFLAALDLIISVRTALLDSRPALPVETTIAADDLLRLQSFAPASWSPVDLNSAAPVAIDADSGTGCLLFRLPGSTLSYAEMVHAADFQHDELSWADQPNGVMRIARRLFRTSLEKGVILRARVRGLFLPRQNDAAIAAECYAAFVATDPPLGT